jgi:predicted DNA-binding transcriptional regulator YafY
MALGLGLRVLAAEADAERRAEIMQLARLLEDELGAAEAQAAAVEVEFGEDDFRGDLAEAIAARVYCDVLYLKADGSAPAARRIAPVRLVYARGRWYVRAYADGELRNFRLDRVLGVQVCAASHDFADADVPAFDTNGAQAVTVRYSEEVARWVAEREGAQCEADGTLVVTREVADMNWLVRHVLQYGGEAVVETEAGRVAVREALGPTLHS